MSTPTITLAAPKAAAPKAPLKSVTAPVATVAKTHPTVPSGMVSHHHRPNTRPTTSIVGITFLAYPSHERLRPPVQLADPFIRTQVWRAVSGFNLRSESAGAA